MARASLTLILTILLTTILCLTLWQILVSPYMHLQFGPDRAYMHVPKIRPQTQISYSYKTLPRWDFTRLINLDNFTFLLTNTVCEETTPLQLLIVVSSAPKNIDKRNAIRETWGQKRDNMKLLFMLGFVPDQKQQDDFDTEDRRYNDLVQGNFYDDYKNMTYKFVMAFKYIVYFCPNVKYILKTDDDLFVNTPLIMEYLKILPPPEGKKDFMFCNIMDGSPAIREPSKWHVAFKEFPHAAYPVYCSGFGIIFSYDVVFRLYREAQRGEYFWVDDAHITGTLANRKNAPATSSLHGVKKKKRRKKIWSFTIYNGVKGPVIFFHGPRNIEPHIVQILKAASENRNYTLRDVQTPITNNK